MKHYSIQLVDSVTNNAIIASGGKAYVATAGSAAKATLYTESGAALANPISLTYGHLDFYVADSVNEVDLYVQAPSGHFIIAKGLEASGPNSLYVDKSRLDTTMVIPFAAANQAGDATETGCGFTAMGAVQPGVAVVISTVDSTETVDFGTLSSDSGDADGFIDGISVATAGYVKATNANGAVTLGALLYVQDSANAGDDFPEQNTTMYGKQFTYTLSAGSDTAEGFFIVPIRLLPTNL